jgi:hypothetical protein
VFQTLAVHRVEVWQLDPSKAWARVQRLRDSTAKVREQLSLSELELELPELLVQVQAAYRHQQPLQYSLAWASKLQTVLRLY